jgi:hypothetical protein
LKRIGLRPLLWFDCTAAAIAGAIMLTLGGRLAPWFGLPRGLLVFTGLVNLAYGTYSFSLARRAAPSPRAVRALVAANASWVLVCLVLAGYLAGPGSWLGSAYLLAEGAFVGLLAALEARSLAACGQCEPSRGRALPGEEKSDRDSGP